MPCILKTKSCENTETRETLAYEIIEDLKSESYKVEEESRRRPDSYPFTSRMHHFEKGMVTQDEDLTSIEIGDIINLPKLLFTKNRDYLVKYNSDEKVYVFASLYKIFLGVYKASLAILVS